MSVVQRTRRPATVPGRPPILRHLTRLLVGAVAALILTVGSGAPAAAHVKITGSEPANASKIDGPVTEVTLKYSKPCQPVKDRFEVRGADGTVIAPASIRNADPSTIVVTMADPLPEGRVRVKWATRAGDSHVMSGTVAFTVNSVASGETTAPADAAPDAAPAGDVPAVEAATDETTADGATDEAAAGAQADVAELDTTALSAEASTGVADWLATLARWVVYAALLVVVGGLGYLAWVHRGSVAETRRFVFWVRRAAALVIVGAVLGWLAQTMIYAGGGILGMFSPSAWGDVITSYFAVGTLARIGGALLVLRFLEMDVAHVTPPRHRRAAVGEDTGWGAVRVGGGGVALLERPDVVAPTRLRTSSSPLAFLGAAVLVVSEWFTGHTAVTEPWPVVVASDAAHVVAAALWATGAVMLAVTLQGRRRRGEPLDAALLGTRFSVVATWSLVAVAVSGAVLAWTIMEGLGGLFSTSFGRLLVAKLAVVAVIAGIGAYNNRRLVPELATRDADVERQFVRTVSIEAVLFGVVLVVTGLLVAASPV